MRGVCQVLRLLPGAGGGCCLGGQQSPRQAEALQLCLSIPCTLEMPKALTAKAFGKPLQSSSSGVLCREEWNLWRIWRGRQSADSRPRPMSRAAEGSSVLKHQYQRSLQCNTMSLNAVRQQTAATHVPSFTLCVCIEFALDLGEGPQRTAVLHVYHAFTAFYTERGGGTATLAMPMSTPLTAVTRTALSLVRHWPPFIPWRHAAKASLLAWS
mmetsp:Transcript_107231/g.313558  ORF Transcript_107231/g.313558 Transcript_107231/m.313558 type:complete len:212 (-) Transcript_107231:42-677(-)